jgi:hypothetical protein
LRVPVATTAATISPRSTGRLTKARSPLSPALRQYINAAVEAAMARRMSIQRERLAMPLKVTAGPGLFKPVRADCRRIRLHEKPTKTDLNTKARRSRSPGSTTKVAKG